MATSPEESLSSDTAQSFDFLKRIKEVVSGAVKGASTDLAGAPVDIINTVLGAVGVPVSKEPIGGSKSLRRLAGVGVEDASLFETAGTFLNPENAAKAMIIGAARIPERIRKFENFKSDPSDTIAQIRTKRFDESNFYFDKDGEIKTFISDRSAQIKEISPGVTQIGGNTLGDVLDHPTLFKLYPELKTIEMRFGGAPGSGSMQPDNSFMTIGAQDTKAQELSVILHETQHAIQHIEGFGKGGNTRQFLTFDPTSVQEKINRARKSGDVGQMKAADRFASKLNDQLKEATNRYLNLPGEQEARFTQNRASLTTAELRDELRILISRGDTPQTYDTRPIRPVPTPSEKTPNWLSGNPAASQTPAKK